MPKYHGRGSKGAKLAVLSEWEGHTPSPVSVTSQLWASVSSVYVIEGGRWKCCLVLAVSQNYPDVHIEIPHIIFSIQEMRTWWCSRYRCRLTRPGSLERFSRICVSPGFFGSPSLSKTILVAEVAARRFC